MSVREEVKMLLAKEATTLTKLAEEMTLKTNRKYTMKGLSNKLSQKTLRYEEFMIILDILGYKISYEKK